MRVPGFIGPTYQLASRNVSVEECINMFPETIEFGGQGFYYRTTAGLTQAANLTDGPHRAHFAQDGRAFVVAGGTFYEYFADDTYVARGAVAFDGNPASMTSNGYGGHQLLIITGGKGYIFDLNANTLTEITAAAMPNATAFPTNPLSCGFVDGYFVVLDAIGNTMHLSDLFDGTSWSGLDVAQRSTASDNLVAMMIGQREIRLSGSKTSESWYNSGAANFPFAPIPGSYVQSGSVAPWSGQNIDNAFFWIIGNDTGGGVVARSEGYLPKRISTHAIETFLRNTGSLHDVESWTWTIDGHLFYVLYSPTGNWTLVYDVSTNMWHKWLWTNIVANTLDAHRGRCHMNAFGNHYVGDRATGQMYKLSLNVYSDAGNAVQRIRIFPHLRKGDTLSWMFYLNAELDCDKGIGLPAGQGVEPLVWLSWSNDGGNTFADEYFVSCGVQGDNDITVGWDRLGRARRRTFKLRSSDPVPHRWYAFYIEVEGGTS